MENKSGRSCTPKLFSAPDVSRMLGIPEKAVREMMDNGTIVGYRVSERSHRRVSSDALADFMRENGFDVSRIDSFTGK